VNRITRAVILAAGRGMRMMPLTDVIPKPMAPMAGSTLIARGIAHLRLHLDEVHITVGYKGAMLASHVIEHNVSSVINTEGHGNAWWLYNSLLKHCADPLLVLTCDNVVDLDFERLADDYFALGQPTGMVIPVRPVDGLEGDYIFHDEQRVTELTRSKQSDIYCSGMQILHPARINRTTREADDFYGVWSQLMAQGELACSRVYPRSWLAIDTIEQLGMASALLAAK
jgi:NDP-sugar pyrophosphorylase family protein